MCFEKRKLERFELALLGEVAKINNKNDSWDCIIQRCVVRDISSEGGFFQIKKPLPVDTEVDVCFDLPASSLDKYKGRKGLAEVKGLVVRTEENGVAIRFFGPYKMRPYQTFDLSILRIQPFGQLPLNNAYFDSGVREAAGMD
jgi:hypothetical protein